MLGLPNLRETCNQLKTHPTIRGAGIAKASAGFCVCGTAQNRLSVTNVLIVDTDLGLVFWLGQALDAAGYETYPAKGVTEAVSLLAELKLRIDVLIVRHDLEGAETFASELRWSQGGHLKTVALLEDADGERSAHWDA